MLEVSGFYHFKLYSENNQSYIFLILFSSLFIPSTFSTLSQQMDYSGVLIRSQFHKVFIAYLSPADQLHVILDPQRLINRNQSQEEGLRWGGGGKGKDVKCAQSLSLPAAIRVQGNSFKFWYCSVITCAHARTAEDFKMSTGGTKLNSHQYVQVSLTCSSLQSMQTHFLTSLGLGSAKRVHQHWFSGSLRVSASNSVLPLSLLWQSPKKTAQSPPGTLAGRSYQVSSIEENFTYGAFVLLILLGIPTALKLQYCLVDMGVLENICMLATPVPANLQCKRDAISQ